MKEMHFFQQTTNIGTRVELLTISNVFATEWSIQFADRMHRGLMLHLRGTSDIFLCYYSLAKENAMTESQMPACLPRKMQSPARKLRKPGIYFSQQY
jgi:hypothetical protein